jgi:hypothetical protein
MSRGGCGGGDGAAQRGPIGQRASTAVGMRAAAAGNPGRIVRTGEGTGGTSAAAAALGGGVGDKKIILCYLIFNVGRGGRLSGRQSCSCHFPSVRFLF